MILLAALLPVRALDRSSPPPGNVIFFRWMLSAFRFWTMRFLVEALHLYSFATFSTLLDILASRDSFLWGGLLLLPA